MNAKNLNGKPGARANLSRTGFDMSQEFAFTSSVGMCLPTYQDFLNVGESVHFSGDMIIRTQPLVTASMCDIDIYLDWFFVPASMLFTLWPSKRWQTNDFVSDFYDQGDTLSDKLPVFNIQGYLSQDDYSVPVNNLYSNSPWDASFECLGKSHFRLANHLGFNPYGIFNGDGTAKTEYASQDNPNVFPLFALAYQCIWQDYFRLPVDDYVRRRMSFNIDSYAFLADPAFDTSKSLFQLNYRPRNMDYFTSVKASPLFSSVNSFSDGFEDVAAVLSNVNNYLDTRSVFTGKSDGEMEPVNARDATQTVMTSNAATLSTGSIRNIFAVEKLLRVTGRAKKDYDSQVLAHFGFKVPHDVKHELTHIKQQHAILHIGEVISTSDTYSEGSGSALGAIGGKGYGVISAPKKPWSFTAPVDGVFMCIFSSAPRQRYFGTFDKQNVLTDRLSFYQPEFDKLGMQPLWAYEAFGFHPNYVQERFGWQYRYEQWKRKYNRVSEAFAAPDKYSGTVNQNVSWVNGTRPFGTAFATPLTPSSIGSNGKGLFVSPMDINQIMVVPYTPEWSDTYKQNAPTMFYTDPFINAFRANVKKVSTMSSFGESDLNGI